MADKQVVFGYFYWKAGFRDPVSERIPVNSDTPEPKSYLLKQPLNEIEMQLSLLILEKRYPISGRSIT